MAFQASRKLYMLGTCDEVTCCPLGRGHMGVIMLEVEPAPMAVQKLRSSGWEVRRNQAAFMPGQCSPDPVSRCPVSVSRAVNNDGGIAGNQPASHRAGKLAERRWGPHWPSGEGERCRDKSMREGPARTT